MYACRPGLIAIDLRLFIFFRGASLLSGPFSFSFRFFIFILKALHRQPKAFVVILGLFLSSRAFLHRHPGPILHCHPEVLFCHPGVFLHCHPEGEARRISAHRQRCLTTRSFAALRMTGVYACRPGLTVIVLMLFISFGRLHCYPDLFHFHSGFSFSLSAQGLCCYPGALFYHSGARFIVILRAKPEGSPRTANAS